MPGDFWEEEKEDEEAGGARGGRGWEGRGRRWRGERKREGGGGGGERERGGGGRGEGTRRRREIRGEGARRRRRRREGRESEEAERGERERGGAPGGRVEQSSSLVPSQWQTRVDVQALSTSRWARSLFLTRTPHTYVLQGKCGTLRHQQIETLALGISRLGKVEAPFSPRYSLDIARACISLILPNARSEPDRECVYVDLCV